MCAVKGVFNSRITEHGFKRLHDPSHDPVTHRIVAVFGLSAVPF